MAAFPELEIEELRAEIQQEEALTKMLERSIEELEEMSTDLKSRYGDIDSEQNEWKTRCEIQEEVNQQLSKQIEQLRVKVREGEKMVGGTGSSGAVNMERLLEMTEVTPYMLKLLEREKINLNTEWNALNFRIDKESKAYFAALEKRKRSKTQMSDYVASVSSRAKSQAQNPVRSVMGTNRTSESNTFRLTSKAEAESPTRLAFMNEKRD